jgi:CRP/FNR family cyclic AMP-dependent transcriptional regulator
VHFTSEKLEELADEIPAFGAALRAAAAGRVERG